MKMVMASMRTMNRNMRVCAEQQHQEQQPHHSSTHSLDTLDLLLRTPAANPSLSLVCTLGVVLLSLLLLLQQQDRSHRVVLQERFRLPPLHAARPRRIMRLITPTHKRRDSPCGSRSHSHINNRSINAQRP
jgi:hypothetical protein